MEFLPRVFPKLEDDKLKKSQNTNSNTNTFSLSRIKKFKQQSFTPIVLPPLQQGEQSIFLNHQQQQQQKPAGLFHRHLSGGNKLRKHRNSYITTTTAGGVNVEATANNNMATVKIRSSSMDELRPTVTEEHWYSADSDTDPDSLTLLSAQQQQQQQQSVGNNNVNAIGSLSTLGLSGHNNLNCNNNNNNNNANSNIIGNNNSNNNTNSNNMTQSSLMMQRRNSAENNNGRHDIGVIPDVPKAPKFRRGPTTSGLKEKWRESWTQSKTLSKNSMDEENGLLRWFSLRKNQGPPHLNNKHGDNNGSTASIRNSTVVDGVKNSTMTNNSSGLQSLSEEDCKRISFNIEDEEGYWPRRTVQPPTLPPAPLELTAKQLTRRHIVAALVHTENNYVAALQRLVNEYKKPLDGMQPVMLSHSKISTIFHRLPEILQSHSLFRIALAEYIRRWDTDEKIGDVFVASFSKSLVLDIYSEFINNFGRAMETAKSEARRKSSFAEFLKIKQITASDRLSLFGLMVKPVQRFPQFILLLQDLLKETPKDHHDRMSLQLALTQLESLAALLNERKRESEQFQAFRETIKSITGGKFVLLRSVVDDPSRSLLRQDVVTQLEFDSNGGSVAKSKYRKLLLLNDLLICVSLSQSSSNSNSQHGSHERGSSSASQLNSNQSNVKENNSSWGSSSTSGKVEKSVFKWSFRVQDVEVDDISISPTMSRLVPSSQKLTRSSSLVSPIENESQLSKSLLEEMQSLMYDYEVLSRILTLVTSLKSSYDGLNEITIKELMLEIQHQIRCRDEQISYFDSSCLTLLLGNPSSHNREKVVFQMSSPSVRNEWIEELKLAQLALDSNNSPAWDVPEESACRHHKLPLFVRSLPLCRSPQLTTVKCGCFFTHTFVSPTGRSKILDYLWVSCTDGISSHITAFRSHQNTLKEVTSFDLMEEKINDLLFVSGYVWIATESQKILIYDPTDPETKGSVNQQSLSASVIKLALFENVIYAGLGDGQLVIYTKFNDPLDIEPEIILKLGSEPISSLFGSREHIYASCGNAVVIVDVKTHTIERNVVLTHHTGPITHMACSGVGLWIVSGASDTICLYHLETLQHLQDVSINPSISRSLIRDPLRRYKDCKITTLSAHKGWLWVGTNIGFILTIPLPRLEGVPIISTGKANLSFHGYYGPVTFLMPLIKKPRHIPIVGTSKHTSKKSVQIATRNDEVISKKELQQQHQLEELEKQNVPTPGANLSDNVEGVATTKDTFSPITPRIANNLEISPQTSISSGLSGSHDGSGNETLLGVGPTTSRSTSLSPSSSSVTASSSYNKALVVLRKKNSRDSVFARNCKTLPRGGPIPSNLRFSIDSDVYGLYGNLINVRGLEDEGRFVDPLYDALRRSDPELVAVDAKNSTMDRRCKMRMSRPRSLDLSNWSVDSKISNSSEESGGGGITSRLSGGSSCNTIENTSNNSPPTTIARHSPNRNTLTDTTASGLSTETNPSLSTPNNSNVGTTPRKTIMRATNKANKAAKANQEKTIIVVVGGRGYVQLKPQSLQDHVELSSSGAHVSESGGKQITNLTIWQMRA